MDRWFSGKSGLSNGELLAFGLAIFFAGRFFATPDTEVQARTAIFAAGAAAGAATGATQQPAQLNADQTPAAQTADLAPFPQGQNYSYGYPYDDGAGYGYPRGPMG